MFSSPITTTEDELVEKILVPWIFRCYFGLRLSLGIPIKVGSRDPGNQSPPGPLVHQNKNKNDICEFGN